MNTNWTWTRCLATALTLMTAINADPAGNQLPDWARTHPVDPQHPDIATCATGSPEVSLTATLTTDPLDGPILLEDASFIEIITSFNRERVPERTVHAKGGGAYGVFTVTHDITRYTKMTMFSQVGEKTPLFARMSTVMGELGSADTVMDPRGFAIKFYTKDGIFDLLTLSFTGFPIRDPILFPSLIHSRKRNPRTHLPDANMLWDFNSLRPETIQNTLRLFSDLGIPDGFRHMDAFAVNAFKFVNAAGDVHYVKFHLLTQQGIRNLTFAEATRIAGEDPNYAIRDLYNSIATKRFPRWKMYLQILSVEDTNKLPDAFDALKAWDTTRFPLRPVGELVLNRNPENVFSEVEQAAFDPSNLVPGIQFSEDRLLQGRSFIYKDTQRHRVSANFEQLPINRPRNVAFNRIHNYLRDGMACLHASAAPNYFPNSFGGPKVSMSPHDSVGPPDYIHGKALRTDSGPIGDNYSQATTFYEGLTPDQQHRLVDNVVRSLSQAVERVQERTLGVLKNVSHDLEHRVKRGLEVAAAARKAVDNAEVPAEDPVTDI